VDVAGKEDIRMYRISRGSRGMLFYLMIDMSSMTED